MANVIRLRRSAVQGNVPTTGQIALGEVAINTFDGKLFIKKDNGTESIVEVGAGGGGSNTTPSALTPGATVTPDLSVSSNFTLTLDQSTTLQTPTNLTAGVSGAIVITQDATGGHTMAFSSAYKFEDGNAPSLTTTANAVDVLAYYVESATRITAKLVTDSK